MPNLDYLKVGCGFLTACSGFWAAWLWHASAKIVIPVPDIRIDYGIHPDDPFIQAMTTVSSLNKKAAFWTGIAVLFGAIASLIEAFKLAFPCLAQ